MEALIMTAPGGAENTKITEVDVPAPGAGEVSIDVAWAGLNFIDVMARRGDPGYTAGWPHRPGLEVAGFVREVGQDVTGINVGDRVAAVCSGGGLAGTAVASAAVTVLVPDEIPLQTAAAVPLGLATSLLLLTHAGRFTAGTSVLVHSAAGGIGSAIAGLVPLLGGGQLIGTVGSADKAHAAVEAGYETVLLRDDNLEGGILAATGGRGVNLILDPLGTTCLGLDLEVAAPGGRIVLFGNATGGAMADLPPVGSLIRGNLAISGFSHRGLTADAPKDVARSIRQMLEFLASGRFGFPVTELKSLHDVSDAYDLLATGRGTGKYVAAVSGVR
ncbi:zinc-binding alcohol dehydrogenase family protein [Streptomyces sp. NPDC020490]|uniref:zinc-binding alcohol dehydrogenase family protein n=1 Tax=Streptomyces sp. NPDC020490 TaxID=3365078 RepID=UPI0037AC1C3D